MSQNIAVLSLSVLASATITNQTFVTVAGATATAAGNALGVSRSDASSGDYVTVDVIGTAAVTAGAAVAAGAAVEVGSGGKAVTHASGVTVGRALTAATADGDTIEVLLIAN